MIILQINTVINIGSTGRIAEQIGETIKKNGEDSYIAFSRPGLPSSSLPVQIGNQQDIYKHVLISRLFDQHGFGSKTATNRFIEEIEILDPDIIHLHNIHGYYLHIGILFNFLKVINKPVVWTFHDSWPYTGHCAYYESVNCEKWKIECHHCPKTKMYPQSWFFDNSQKNFKKKKVLFTGINNMHIITPSKWLKDQIKESFLKNYPIGVIHNGVDLKIFKPSNSVNFLSSQGIKKKLTVLGVASIWDKRKGLQDFIDLAKLLNNSFQIVLIGLSKSQIKSLPKNMKGILRTENVQELARWYSSAAVFINPTSQDNFPTTNIEALACGTPVITYDTGGSPEAIDENTGLVVDKGDINGLKNAIDTIITEKKKFSVVLCNERAKKYFNKDDRFMDYYNLYKELVR